MKLNNVDIYTENQPLKRPKIVIDMDKLITMAQQRPQPTHDAKFYNNLWADIHRTSKDTNLEPAQVLAAVREILNKLNGCGCRSAALNFLDVLLNFNDDNINLYSDSLEQFFVHYHNLVNSKLSKSPFIWQT